MSGGQYQVINLSARDVGIIVKTSDPATMEEVIARIKREVPNPQISEVGSGGIWIRKLRGHDRQIGEQIKIELLQMGWQLIGETVGWDGEYTLRRPLAPAASAAGRVPDIADQLEKLANLRKSGTLSDAEFEAAKRKLLGT